MLEECTVEAQSVSSNVHPMLTDDSSGQLVNELGSTVAVFKAVVPLLQEQNNQVGLLIHMVKTHVDALTSLRRGITLLSVLISISIIIQVILVLFFYW